jgi:hypothetical protein
MPRPNLLSPNIDVGIWHPARPVEDTERLVWLGTTDTGIDLFLVPIRGGAVMRYVEHNGGWQYLHRG